MGPSACSEKFKKPLSTCCKFKKTSYNLFYLQKIQKEFKKCKKDMFSQTVRHDPGPHVGTVSAWYITGGMGQHGQPLMSRLDIEHKSEIT